MKLRERLSGQSYAVYSVTGLSVGTSVGAALDDIGVGIAAGLCAGIAIGSVTRYPDREKGMSSGRHGRNKRRNGA